MRRNILIILAVTAFFSGCAYQGVVVEKRFRPVPFSYSLGLDAMYNFKLRDGSTGQTNSQMVTPDVFATYRVGDYFNDLQQPPAHDDKELEGFRLLPREMQEGPYQPVRVMQMRSSQTTGAKVAARGPTQPAGDVKILRWQTVRVVPIQSTQKAVAAVAVRAPQATGDVKISRRQIVMIAPIQLPEAAAKAAVHGPDQVTRDMKILRWQTVRIVQIQSPDKVAPKVAVHAPDKITRDVKILRWQAVRIVPIQPPANVAAKLRVPSHPRAKNSVKTASSRSRYQHSAKIAQPEKKRVKVAASSHSRKTVASVN